MSNPDRLKSSFVALTIIAFLALCPTLLAQRETRPSSQGRATPKVLIFKSRGVSRAPQDAGPQPLPPPKELSAASKKEMLKDLHLAQEPGSIYFKVTLRNSFVAGKGYINFGNPYSVESYHDHVEWQPPNNEKQKFVEIFLNSEAAGRHYLIDCTVNQVYMSNYPYKIWRGSTDLLQTIEAQNNAIYGQHLVFVIEATDDGWHSFRISGGGNWYFYSCEVTHL
ncbi:MAG TPA: hypothetical protein VIG25_02070 [Pyrinomonadaceae bacterium]